MVSCVYSILGGKRVYKDVLFNLCDYISFQEMYGRIETNDEGDVTMRKVVEHIKGVEAGSGKNEWVMFWMNVYYTYSF